MSFRYMGRLVYQLGVRAAQGASRDQASKCAGDAAVKSRVQAGARRFSTNTSRDAVGKAATKGVNSIKQKEEGLRTVMFLTIWGPG